MSEKFIGAGWAFPMRINDSGGVSLVSGDREIEESIRIILGTAEGERPMRPEFGCGIHEFVFAPADSSTAGRIAHEVRKALERWEPRIDLSEVVVTFDPVESNGLYIDVQYSIRGSNDPRNLVFPFYTIPTEA
jgi:phage baseplate assembly protein W